MTDNFLPTRKVGEVALEVRGPQGSLIQSWRGPMQSFLANFLRVQTRFLIEKTPLLWRLDAESTTGPTRMSMRGNTGTDVIGIIIGSSPRAVAGTDRKLGTRYPQGTFPRSFQYGAGTYLDPAPTFPGGGTVQFRYQRLFTNNSGSSLTVNEVGIGQRDRILVVRDKVGPVTVPNNTTLTVTYTFYTLP